MRIINYYRVSTAKQGRSGLGLEAQRAAILSFCANRGCEPLGEYVEVESGKHDDRPELAKALHHARVTGATLVIAKLDRLSRNLAFLAALQDAGTKFVAADMPEANELTIHIMAAMAQAERKAISRRTKEALAVAKARGTKLGNPMGAAAFGPYKGNGAAVVAIKAKSDAFANDIIPIVEAIRADGHVSLRAIASELNKRGIVTARGGRWGPQTVSDLVRRSSVSAEPHETAAEAR
jgi:DNA invertase Pin-like site-specific DNA recombinase